MDIVRLKPSQWPNWRDRLIAFAKRHGDRRITAAGLRAMLLAEATGACAPSSVAVVIAHDQGRLLGFAFAVNAGETACLVVVRPDARGGGIGRRLIEALANRCGGRLCCKIAADNPASMQLFFHAGLKAVSVETGPTGKPTLRFETDGFHMAAAHAEAPAKEAL
ncbi:GCN5-related N-acetyltransferase [Paenibacillus curdlanolyticus YK9]|uniref:GCN5-related N-acetyltransferase n=1 Tax=Paenibacillus curdlanolyticus YK9 TaxID=717606 RepID=E0IBY2_9BACL|nr:GNAT family N-acetyltransferase [Paenibacillus curdlanolyticus]EFM10212.1 GCN5-related N-acetyltransferase [Paenibacillus curdlanolyticus YK9]